MDTYPYEIGTEFSFDAPIRRAFTVTPSANKLSLPTRAIMVSASCTVTGSLVGMDGASHTTFTLTPGVLYPFAFSYITAVSNAASINGYA